MKTRLMIDSTFIKEFKKYARYGIYKNYKGKSIKWLV